MDSNYLFLFGGVALFGGYAIWHFLRSHSLLRGWAKDQGFEILDVRRSLNGPFNWKTSGSQAVFRVRVKDKGGAKRNGWVLCGNYWSGVFSNRIEVQWDLDPQAPRLI
jgi:hypothetical protein